MQNQNKSKPDVNPREAPDAEIVSSVSITDNAISGKMMQMLTFTMDGQTDNMSSTLCF